MRRYTRSKSAVTMSAQMPAVSGAKLAARAALSLLVSGLLLWLLSTRIAHIDLAELRRAFSQLSSLSWLYAVGLTGLSFWAVGRYDAVLHCYFATGLPNAVTRRAGICAIAVSQTLGLGVITGAILRWRMLPGMSLWQTTRLTAAVAVSFLAGWAVITAITLLVLPTAPFKPQAALVLTGASILAMICLYPPQGCRKWPNGFILSRLVGLAAIDTLAAAAAFYMLCPETLDLPLPILLPAFLLALGAGLVSGTPGGVGAFEITLIALLPDQPPTPLLAAILAWRVTYYALPAVIGAGLAIKGPGLRDKPDAAGSPLLLNITRRPETGLVHQGEHTLWAANKTAGWLCAQTPHLMIGLFDPICAQDAASLSHSMVQLRDRARTVARLPVMYKCCARMAATARKMGYVAHLTGQEAHLDPRTYRLNNSARSGLRRKLRRAEAAQITVSGPEDNGIIPWAELDRIADTWAKAHGGERGFSMGRYAIGLVRQQRLYIAWKGGQPIAFATFHATEQEWTLDLMRHGTNLPDGTMHLLVHTAIEDAASLGLPRISLAAVPTLALSAQNGIATTTVRKALRAFTRFGGHEKDASGLFRFKSCFAPKWQPLYLVAPSKAALALAALEISRAIANPPPLPSPQDQVPDNGFASAVPAWHRQRR